MADITASILAPIFSLFTNLVDLDFTQHASNWFYATFPSADPSSTIFSSASIVRLHADVQTLDDFLYLLDGRLPRLQRLTIYIAGIDHSDVVADAKVCRSVMVSIRKDFFDLVLKGSSESEEFVVQFTSSRQSIR